MDERDVLIEIREMAANDRQPDCDIDTLKRAADEIENLRRLLDSRDAFLVSRDIFSEYA